MLRKSGPDPKDVWVRIFEITEPQRHKKGFTVYKVISTVFPRNFPDGATKITMWKRYKDFKQLHKDLEQVFRQLYLKGTFPKLPKDKIFGRFDPIVVEERRKSAIELLEFAASIPLLFTNKVFVKFFEEGHHPGDFLGNCSVKENFIFGDNNVLIEEEKDNIDCLIPVKVWNTECDINRDHGIDVDHVEDAVSSPSYSCSSSPEHSLNNGTEQQNEPTSMTISTSSAHIPNVITFSDSSVCPTYLQFTNRIISDGAPCIISQSDRQSESTIVPSASFAENISSGNERNVRGFETLSSSLSLEDLTSTNNVITACDDMRNRNLRTTRFNLFDFLPVFSKKEKQSEEQGLAESLSSTYVLEAAGHFSVAQHHESNYEYESAFDAYTEGIRILLEGAQNDTDDQRRGIVKKKVAKYLSHAESLKIKLHNLGNRNLIGDTTCPDGHLSSMESLTRSEEDEFVMIDNNVMPSGVDELKSFKMVGYISKILIAVDVSSVGGPECFAIKVLRKSHLPIDSEKPSLIPSTIPFMVKLIKWFNTEDSIILILQYAGGGKLINFVQDYQTKSKSTHSPIANDSILEDSQEVQFQILSSQNRSVASVKTLITPSNAEIKLESGQMEHADELHAGSHNGVCKNFTSNEQAEILENQIVSCNVMTKPDITAAGTIPLIENDICLQQTRKLIENSKFLLETVEKTLELEVQKNKSKILEESFKSKPKVESNCSCQEGIICSLCKLNKATSYPDLKAEAGLFRASFLKFLSRNEEEPYGIEESSYNVTESIMDSNALQMVPECCIKVWAAEIVLALEKLHGQGITYGDLDIKNILLGENGHVLLSYKALWNEIDTKPSWNDYSAPEIKSNVGKSLWKIHPSSDWWSLGAILFLLLIGQKLQDVHPEGIHPQTIICIPTNNICGESISSMTKSLLLELLHFTPNLRLGYYGAAEIKSHPFFSGIDWDKAEKSAYV